MCYEICSLVAFESPAACARCLWLRSTSAIGGDTEADPNTGDQADPDHPECPGAPGAISHLGPCAAQRPALRPRENDGDLFAHAQYEQRYLERERHPSAPGRAGLSGAGLRFSWQW